MRLCAARAVAVLLMAPPVSAPAQRLVRPPPDPALRPGDVLRINVWRHPELSGDFVVAPDSTLVDPVYQVVKVAGVPRPVVRERLRGVLSSYEQGVPFVLQPVFPVTVAGEVRQPNLYRLPEGTTFAQAIAQAGGPTGLGRVEKGKGIRRGSTVMIDLGQGYLKYERLTIASGDQILVGR